MEAITIDSIRVLDNDSIFEDFFAVTCYSVQVSSKSDIKKV